MTYVLGAPQRVDVRVPLAQAATLRPGPLSVINGQPATHAASVCCLSARGLSITVPVDEHTAARLERTCRREANHRRRTIPAILAVTLGLAALCVVAIVQYDWNLAKALACVAPVFALAVEAAIVWPSRGKARQHPERVGQQVLVRDVDPQAAAAWYAANPGSGMELLVRS